MPKKPKQNKSTAGALAEGTIDGVPYEVHDAYHALHRAHKIVGDKKLMAKVKEHAHTLAEENRQVAHHADMLARSGKISGNAMAKFKKMAPIA